MTIDIEQQREEFKKWLLEEHMLDSEWNSERNCFKDFAAHLAYKAWLSAKRATDEDAGSWRPIASAPKNQSVMLAMKCGPIYCGRQRYGNLGEPSQDTFAWRCDSSGTFGNPTHWMPLPSHPSNTGGGD